MKIATVGKGGSGKTTLAGILARILAETSNKMLAVDGDPNPNLALTLGISPEAADDICYIPPNIMQLAQGADGSRTLNMTLSEKEVIRRYAAHAPGGIDLLVMGKPADGSAGSGCMCASHRAVRGLITKMSGYSAHTITDMEAGLEHLKRGTARNVDLMLVVTEPYYRSLEAAARTWRLADELDIQQIRVVANKVRNREDRAAITEFCQRHDMTIIGEVPQDEAFLEAERTARAPIDHAPDSPGVRAVRALASEIRALEATMNVNLTECV